MLGTCSVCGNRSTGTRETTHAPGLPTSGGLHTHCSVRRSRWLSFGHSMGSGFTITWSGTHWPGAPVVPGLQAQSPFGPATLSFGQVGAGGWSDTHRPGRPWVPSLQTHAPLGAVTLSFGQLGAGGGTGTHWPGVPCVPGLHMQAPLSPGTLSRGHFGGSGLGGTQARPFQTSPGSQHPPPGLTWLGGQTGGLAQAAAGSLSVAEAVYCTPLLECRTAAEIDALTVLVMAHWLRTASALGTNTAICRLVLLPTASV